MNGAILFRCNRLSVLYFGGYYEIKDVLKLSDSRREGR
jgi:hypothetical protein